MRLLNLQLGGGGGAATAAPSSPSLQDLFGPSSAVAKGEPPAPPRVVTPPKPRLVIPHGTTRIVEDLPADEYHADPCEGPSLSSSIANILDRDSPSKAWAAHPKLGGKARKHTEAFTRGTLIHALMLGEEESIEVVRADDFKTKAARAQRDEAFAQGRTPVIEADFDEASVAAQRITTKMAGLGIVLYGKTEVSAFWTEIASSGERVQCRGRWDHVAAVDGRVVIHDMKSTIRAHPDLLAKKIDDYGYCTQSAAYCRAAEEIYGVPRGQVTYLLVFVELAEPYEVTPVALSQGFADIGERRWQRAVDTWARCLREGRWPGYVDRVVTVAPPVWTVRRELEREEDDESGDAAREE